MIVDRTFVLRQNALVIPDTTISVATTSPTAAGFEAENVMNYIPSRPAKFDAAPLATKRIGFQLSRSISCDMLCLIEVHSKVETTVAIGDYLVERPMEFRLMRGSTGITEVFTWTTITSGFAKWGFNAFRKFNPFTDQFWSVEFRMSSTGEDNMLGACIGGIMLGKSLQLDSNPLLPYPRGLHTSGIFQPTRYRTGTFFQRSPSARSYPMRIKHETDDDRAFFMGWLAGFGEQRLTGTDLVRIRGDVPTVLVPPEMHLDATNNYGGCVFGAFDPDSRFDSLIGQQGITDIVFDEMV